MRNLSSFLPGLLALAAASPAQSVVVPNANENMRGNGGINTLVRNAGNPRTYMLGLPASELAGIPVGATINGVSIRASISSSNAALWPPADATWADYEISVGPAIPLASWTGTFASNFASAPVMVRDGAMTIEANTFANDPLRPAPDPNPFGLFFFDFQRPYTYTGGDLAILFTHTGSDQSTFIYIDRLVTVGSIVQCYSASAFQAAVGSQANYSIPRVHYGYGVGCPGSSGTPPMLVQTNNVTGGGEVTFAIGNAPANAPAVYVIGVTQQNALLPNRCPLYTEPSLTLGVGLSPLGRARLTVRLPATMAVVYLQAVAGDAGAPGGYTSTNGVTLTVRP